MKNIYVTEEDIRKAASKYSNLTELWIGARAVHDAAVERGIIDELYPQRKLKYTTDDAMNLEEFKQTEQDMRDLHAREEYEKEQRMFRIMETIIWVLIVVVLFISIMYMKAQS